MGPPFGIIRSLLGVEVGDGASADEVDAAGGRHEAIRKKLVISHL
ncbi:hypothetical protein MGAST_07480 [Mycobacterium gastri 'Wayne']|nr:hypothetical protein MGAST_07480 [Mycobacterium gastri 'Wayne']